MMSFEVCHTTCEERNLNVVQNREPGKQGEALEHDGDVWPALTQRFIMPKDFAAGGWCESGGFAKGWSCHTQKGREGPQSSRAPQTD